VCSEHFGKTNIRKKDLGKTSITILKASRQEHRSGELYNNGKNSLQKIQMESCQPIKRLKKKKKNNKKEKEEEEEKPHR
jgi:formylmethanofuran dehydrogenase subunit E